MKTLIIVLILTSPVLCQNKISQETYNGLVSRQYKYIPVYNNPPIIVILPYHDTPWNWPINSTYNQYRFRLFRGYQYDFLGYQTQSFKQVYAFNEKRQRIQPLESRRIKRH